MKNNTPSTQARQKSLFQQVIDSFQKPPSPRQVARAKKTLMHAKPGSRAANRAWQILKDAGQLPRCYSAISPDNGGATLATKTAAAPGGHDRSSREEEQH